MLKASDFDLADNTTFAFSSTSTQVREHFTNHVLTEKLHLSATLIWLSLITELTFKTAVILRKILK